MAGGSGLATAVMLAGGVGEMPGAGAEQPELFEADAPLPMPAAQRGVSGPKGGRPAGARNKSTEEWREYILSRYRSPLVALCEIYSRTPQELAEQLGLYEYAYVGSGDGAHVEKRLATGEAFKRQVEAMVAALPYLHQKQPIAIEATGKSAGMIVIGELQGVVDKGDGSITVTFEQPQQNQRVIEATDVQSDDVQSDSAANALNNNEETNGSR